MGPTNRFVSLNIENQTMHILTHLVILWDNESGDAAQHVRCDTSRISCGAILFTYKGGAILFTYKGPIHYMISFYYIDYNIFLDISYQTIYII